ncbi:MAG: NYN domain-containing protein [Erysipelotrichaceae bacterium]|nr:NYN domain-containing protein [Erysipelotrichaceae bacterium]
MKKIVLGLFAAVDAGKTTLSEAFLVASGQRRDGGRVDKGTALLDYNEQERKRGITIFLKEERFLYQDVSFNILDTPGHRDFAEERRRALKAVDAAVFLLSGSETLPAAAIALFRELQEARIPLFLFVNKMDISPYAKEEILRRIRSELSPLCFPREELAEQVALTDEKLLEQYLESETLDPAVLEKAVRERYFYPVFFGSALKQDGIEAFLQELSCYARENNDPQVSAYVYKVSRQGKERLLHTRIFSGTLNSRDPLGEEKIAEIRLYNGKQYESVRSAGPDELCVLRGPENIAAGTFLPSLQQEKQVFPLFLRYRILSEMDSGYLYGQLKQLEEEFPDLDVRYDAARKELSVNLQGELHGDVLKTMLKERCGAEISYTEPPREIRESLSDSVYGFAHFDVLKHFAEVTLQIEPLPVGSGREIRCLPVSAAASVLLSILQEEPPRGIFTDGPLEDVRITILKIETSQKHTTAADIREALTRALYQAQEKTRPLFSEPCAFFRLFTKAEDLGSLQNYLARENIAFTPEEDHLLASSPLPKLQDLRRELSALHTELEVYDQRPQLCADQQAVYASYLPLDPAAHVSSSLYLKNGNVLSVPGSEVEKYAGVVYERRQSSYESGPMKVSEKELQRVWSATYKEKERWIEKEQKKQAEEERRELQLQKSRETCFLIDGYNLLYATEETASLARQDLFAAREKLLDRLSDMQGYFGVRMIVVFDAYKRDSSRPVSTERENLTVVYTQEDHSADRYIQENAGALSQHYRLIVVTSDALVQLSVFGSASLRLSSREFNERYEQLKKKISLPEKKANRPLEDLRAIFYQEDGDQ